MLLLNLKSALGIRFQTITVYTLRHQEFEELFNSFTVLPYMIPAIKALIMPQSNLLHYSK